MSEASGQLSPLRGYQSNVFSQSGEDGVLAEVLSRLGDRANRWCVEVGAWDGLHLSNTACLIRSHNYSAVMVEGDPKRCASITQTHPGANVLPVNAMVGFDGDSRLDAILAGTPVPRDFDVLSIDIDGYDYHVWDSLKDYRPKVVVIEFNPTIPHEVEYIQPKDSTLMTMSSASALVRLARSKGYTLAEVTAFNLILIADEHADAVLGSQRPELDDLRDDSEWRVFIFSTLDGTVLTSKPVNLLWHGIPEVPQRRLQALNPVLRRFPDSGTRAGRARGRIARLWIDPVGAVRRKLQ